MTVPINSPQSQLAHQISSIPFACMFSLLTRFPVKNGKARKENAT
jgi:hypothetical protein